MHKEQLGAERLLSNFASAAGVRLCLFHVHCGSSASLLPHLLPSMLSFFPVYYLV